MNQKYQNATVIINTGVGAVRVCGVSVAEHVQRTAALVVVRVDVCSRLYEAADGGSVGEAARLVQSGVAVSIP